MARVVLCFIGIGACALCLAVGAVVTGDADLECLAIAAIALAATFGCCVWPGL